MYATLRAEMARRGMSVSSLSEMIGMPMVTLRNKVNGRSKFTLPECIIVKKVLGVKMPVETLFEWEDGRNNEDHRRSRGRPRG